MNWLITYGPLQCDRIFSLIDSYENNRSTLDDTIERLDDALDIWNYPSEAWKDPDVLKWAQIFNNFENSRRARPTFSPLDHEELTRAFEALKLQAQSAYCFVHYRAVLSDIEAYKQGRLSLSTLERNFWRLFYNLEEYVSSETYLLLQDEAVGLEMALELEERNPTSEQQGLIDEDVAKAHASLLSLISGLHLE
jgi:hypothetical protein